MKLPPPPWPLILVAALICAVFAVAYAYMGLPTWIVLFAGISFCVLLALALSMRDSRVIESNWEYGRCNDRIARRHKSSGVVEFILWPAGYRHGDYVYPENFWCAFDSSWWPGFVKGPAPAEPAASPAASARS